MATNPVLTEIHSLSPEAKAALGMAGHTLPPLAPTPAAPQEPEPGMLLPTGRNELGASIGGANELGDSVPTVSAPTPAAVAPAPSLARGTTSGDAAERGRLLGTGSGISQISDKIQHSRLGEAHPLIGKLLGGATEGLARIGDAALSFAEPALAINTPGTEYHHQALVNHADRALTQDVANDQKQAQTRDELATAGKTEAETPEVAPSAASTRNLQSATAQNLESETAHRGEATTPELSLYRSLVGAGMSPSEAMKEVERDKQLALKPPSMESKAGTVNGARAFANYHPDTGKYTDQSGKEIPNFVPEPPSALITMGDNHAFQEAERGRGLLDKAEQQYRTAQQGAQGIRAMIDDAMQGGKISARMLPLEGALEVNTANGVKRINRTEVDQYAGGGSLFDRLAGELRGAASGVPFTNEIMGDMKRLADLQEKGAYENYRGTHESVVKRYGLTDEPLLPGPGGEAQPQQHKVGDKVKLGDKTVTIKKIYPDGTFDY